MPETLNHNKELLSNEGTLSATKSGKLKIRAKAVDCIRERKRVDQIQSGKKSEMLGGGYSCTECARFSSLLQKENVSKSIIAAASKHRFLCEPTPTPQNLWEPWTISPTNTREN
jgi:hypothetical protein